jgi:hypothetical protein
VVTSMAGFVVRTQPGARTWMPAAFRYPLAVSRRTPVACSMRRKDQPSRPKAIICCRLSSLNTLLMPREATLPPRVVNVPGDYFSMAGFEVTLYGRFWVTPEGMALSFAARSTGFTRPRRSPPVAPSQHEQTHLRPGPNLRHHQ